MRFTQKFDEEREALKRRKRVMCFRCGGVSGETTTDRFVGCVVCIAALDASAFKRYKVLRRAHLLAAHTDQRALRDAIREKTYELVPGAVRLEGYAGSLHTLDRDYAAAVDALFLPVYGVAPIRCTCCLTANGPGRPAFVETWDGSRFCPVCEPETLRRGFCEVHGRVHFPETVEATKARADLEAAIRRTWKRGPGRPRKEDP